MIAKELKLMGYAGQRNDVFLFLRADGTKYVRFYSAPQYGNAHLEIDELRALLKMLEEL